MNRLHRHVHSHLHRRIFWWFGASILFTGLALMVVTRLMDGVQESPWRRDVARVQTFASNRFAEVWDRPAERHALAAAVAKELDLDLVLKDASGAVMESLGSCQRPYFSGVVTRGPERLGTVSICAERHHWGGGLRSIIPFLLAGMVLWGASGRISRRIVRPLGDLVRVAREIGAGNLAARSQLGCGPRQDEVGVLAEAINDMAGKIERQMADQRELLAGVSHELRTPLARIRLLVEIGRDSGATPKTLDEIDREVMEIDSLVGELLASSRLEFSALTPSRLDAVDVARRAVERAGLEKEVLSVEASPSAFEGDATLVARALANVIENARKHGKGVKAVKVRRHDGMLAFEVEDAGPGFAAGEQGTVFEAFFRGANGKGADQGSLGLGLALVKRIARAHGGTAYAENVPTGGARVGFEVKAAG